MIEEESSDAKKTQRIHGTSLLYEGNRILNSKVQGSCNEEKWVTQRKDEAGGVLAIEKSSNNRATGPPNFGSCNASYQQDAFAWQKWQNGFQKVQQNKCHAFNGNYFYPFTREYPFPIGREYLPYIVHPLGHPPELQFQEFQYFVVIDFEATCDKETIPYPQEIIEFPAVLVNSITGRMEGTFKTYVRPKYHQHLTDFCKELTGIQQIQVDTGVPLNQALHMHDEWLANLGIKNTSFAIVTWSNWDCRVMLESECKFKRINKPPYFNWWINLRVPFHQVFGDVRCNLKEAVQLAGLTWEGRAHSGIDDATNTANLLANLMWRGFRFSITDSLVGQKMPEYSSPLQFRAHQSTGCPSVGLSNDMRECYCRVKTCKRMIRKPGPRLGSFFFGCGNWSAARGAVCPYFEWAS